MLDDLTILKECVQHSECDNQCEHANQNDGIFYARLA